MLKCKSIELSDYTDLDVGLRASYYGLGRCIGASIPINIPHEHRMWEYGSALTAITEHFGEKLTGKTFLDVGSGFSLLGPAIALRGGAVTELDISEKAVATRQDIGHKLGVYLKSRHADFIHDEVGQFDCVSCISVMEHLPPEKQHTAWVKLGHRVDKGGLLVVTCDYGKPGWRESSHRETMFFTDDIKRAVDWLESSGISILPADYTYHGDQVKEYTFYRIIGVRTP